jgi:SAM-dependent methyltransferase
MKILDDVKAYYDKHSVGKLRDFVNGNARVDRAWHTIQNWGPESPKKVLEIGCGIGTLSWLASGAWPEAEVHGVDISEQSILIANALFKRTNLTFSSHESLDEIIKDPSTKYDFIFLVDVYEHITKNDRQHFFNFFKEYLSETGLLFLSCPTINHQNWLKENKPEGLQPIDEDISIKEIMEISEVIHRNLILYKEVSVWHTGDYLHAVIGNRNFSGRLPREDFKQKQPSIKSQLKRKLRSLVFSKQKHFEKEVRIEMVRSAFGSDMLIKIDNYKL